MEVSVLAGEGEVGMVRIRGACVMRGYWNDPARTAKAFDSAGWLLTGDLGYLDAEGNLVLTGRSSDMYIRGGYNVYPAEVESLLVTHPKVADVGIVAAPVPTLGEIGVAFVVPVPGEQVTLDELRDFVRRNLADYKAPDVLHVIQELPVTAMHKINRSALRELAKAATTETAPAPAVGMRGTT
jgi:acyl-CoA synthetase (AMP-forming)/AMP-acid ligase II